MKKSSIIAVAIIYLVSIILVGFLGVRMKIYDEILYVENIVWDYSEYESKSGYKVIIPTEEEKQQGIDYDAKLKYAVIGDIQNLVIHIKCHVEPLNATTPKLAYYLDVTETTDVHLNVLDDNTANVTFNEGTTCYLTIKSTDGKDVEYRILFEMISLNFGF